MLLLAACAQQEVPKRSMVLIVADTLRADRLGLYGNARPTSPAIDALARDGLWFEYALSPAPWTSPAMASLFTSLYPTAHGVVEAPHDNSMPSDALHERALTLAEQLHEAGYVTFGITANAWVSDQRGFAQGFDRFLTRNHLAAGELTELAIEALDGLVGSGRPFLLYVHYMDPHAPYDPATDVVDELHPKGAARTAPTTGLEHLVEQFVTYDAEVLELDRGLAKLFDNLKERGLFDEVFVAFTSDHGEQFYEHGEYGHGRDLFNEELHVPLVFHGPGLRGREATPVSTLDVVPTLLDLVGVEALPDAQGVSLVSQLEERARRGVFSEATMYKPRKAFIDANRRKLVVDLGPAGTEVRKTLGVFDAKLDAAEREPLGSASEVARLMPRLQQVLRESRARQQELGIASVVLDAATVEALRALGYAGGGEEKPAPADRPSTP